MTDRQVRAVIRRCHLKANISHYEQLPKRFRIHWSAATVDPGGTVFGPGPYLKVAVSSRRGFVASGIRVYAPARLRRRLEKAWCRPSSASTATGPKG